MPQDAAAVEDDGGRSDAEPRVVVDAGHLVSLVRSTTLVATTCFVPVQVAGRVAVETEHMDERVDTLVALAASRL